MGTEEMNHYKQLCELNLILFKHPGQNTKTVLSLFLMYAIPLWDFPESAKFILRNPKHLRLKQNRLEFKEQSRPGCCSCLMAKNMSWLKSNDRDSNRILASIDMHFVIQ